MILGIVISEKMKKLIREDAKNAGMTPERDVSALCAPWR
jgi:hypothetical protein